MPWCRSQSVKICCSYCGMGSYFQTTVEKAALEEDLQIGNFRMIFENDKILISAFEVQTTHVRVLQGLVFAI